MKNKTHFEVEMAASDIHELIYSSNPSVTVEGSEFVCTITVDPRMEDRILRDIIIACVHKL